MKDQTLAIHGGTPVFGGKKIDDYMPSWPVPHKETEEKLLTLFRSGKWGMCSEYEQKLIGEFARYQGSKHSVWMNNGTTTLECALLALGVGRGDEVIVPGISWLATAQAPLYVGATPVIVDVDPETVCIDPARIEEAITPRTKAIIPVHLYSALADMPRILEIARKHHLYVIEDCAHAHGARQNGQGAGSFGEVGSFSFQLSKLMTGGEGGCCTTNDDALCDKLHRLSHIGSSRMFPGTKPDPSLLCHQYRLTDFQALIIYDQLRHQEEYFSIRRKNGKLLEEMTKDIPGLMMQKSSCPGDEQPYYFVSFLLKKEELHTGVDRKMILEALTAEGLPMGVGWGAPLYKHLLWNTPEKDYVKHETPHCEEIMFERILTRSHSLLLTETQALEKCAEALRKVMNVYAG